MLDPWNNPASYAPRPVISTAAEENAKIVDDILAMLGEPIPHDPPMSRRSKLVLLACALVMGAAIALQIGA